MADQQVSLDVNVLIQHYDTELGRLQGELVRARAISAQAIREREEIIASLQLQISSLQNSASTVEAKNETQSPG